MRLLALACAAWALPAAALPAPTFNSVLDDVSLRTEAGTGIYGYDLTGDLGILSVGLRDAGRRWLLLWDGNAEFVAGEVAYTHPFYPIYGARGAGEAEAAFRLSPARVASFLASASVNGSLSAIAQQGAPLDAGTAINNLDGLGGFIGTAGVRLGAGVSWLGSRRSLLLELQPLAELDSAQANTPLQAWFGAALRARYDVLKSLAAITEASYAVTPTQAQPGLAATTDLSRWALSLSALKTFGKGWSGGLAFSLGHLDGEVAYAGARTYETAAPIDARVSLLVGFWP